LLIIQGWENALKDGFSEMTQSRFRTSGYAAIFIIGIDKSKESGPPVVE
jgi:hypothetical protein